MSKAQLQAFIGKVNADPALKIRLDGSSNAQAVVALALEAGHSFSEATWTRHIRG